MRKAQAAMEFLMTYGWAILVVLISIGALSYYVITGKSDFLPEKCIISTGSGLYCEDFIAYPGSIVIKVKNLLPESVKITNASVSQGVNSCNLSSVNPSGFIASDSSAILTLAAGDTCDDLTQAEEKIKADISITYVKSILERTATGDSSTKVEGCVATNENCTDSIDNDCDSKTDCADNNCSAYPACASCNDVDHDGYNITGGACGPVDCNDGNTTIHPGASEVCNGVNDDCDGLTSDGVDETWYNQVTACGIGECAANGVYTCQAGIKTDTCTPGAPTPEICDDGMDNDCDSDTDMDDEDCAAPSPSPP